MRYAGWHVRLWGNVELVPPFDEFVPAMVLGVAMRPVKSQVTFVEEAL